MSQDYVNRIAAERAVNTHFGYEMGYDVDKLLSLFDETPDEDVVQKAVDNAIAVKSKMQEAANDPRNKAIMQIFESQFTADIGVFKTVGTGNNGNNRN